MTDRLEITIEFGGNGRIVVVHRNGKGVIIETSNLRYVVEELKRLILEAQTAGTSWVIPQHTNVPRVIP